MKAARKYVMCAVTASVLGLSLLLVTLAVQLSGDPIRRAFTTGDLSEGEVLDFGSLRRNEAVWVERQYFPCDGESAATRFVMSGDPATMEVYDCVFATRFVGPPTIASEKVRGVFPLVPCDSVGLASFMHVLRCRPENHATGAVTYRVEYRRNGAIIGWERFYLPQMFRFRRSDRSEGERKEFAKRYGIPEELVLASITPDEIAEREANQALQTTRTIAP